MLAQGDEIQRLQGELGERKAAQAADCATTARLQRFVDGHHAVM